MNQRPPPPYEEGRAVYQDNAASRRLAAAIARKLETEAKLRKVGRVSRKPLAEVVREATT
jgi:hypothetical protein